jgi:predicted nucleic acid-binding protein
MTPPTATARERDLRDEELAAPELIDLEVASVLRRQLSAGALDARRARFVVDDLRDLPMQRAPHRPRLPRCWELRDNLTAYDAAYVALAEALDAVLLTADTHLANAPWVTCPIEVLRP